jgi:hypothetical protein
VFERVHLDLFGPLKTEDGTAYIQSMVASFSKFAVFQVIPRKDAETVAKCFFDHWISLFGSPLSIVTDRGTDFNTETMQKICNYLQIDKKVITTQHPESNSQAEVLNKKLAKYFRSMITKGVLEWPKLVNSCQYAYNLSIHKALKNSPYSVLFGLDANTPLNNKGFITEPIYGDKYQHALGNRLKMARQLAKSNNMAFREDYVKKFNSKVKTHTFQEGMLVYLHRPELVKINPKLQSPWFGPFVILAMIGQHNSLIQELSNKKTKFVNVNRLRAYNNSIQEWNSFKLTLNANNKNKLDADIKPDKKIKCTADDTAPKFAEFDFDNEVVILNPEVQPIPNIIKVEPEEIEASVEPENATDQEHEAAAPHPTGIDQGKPESLTDTLVRLVSPKKKVTPAIPPKKQTLVPTTRLTRKKALESGTTVPNVDTSTKELEKVEKQKKKTNKKNKK